MMGLGHKSYSSKFRGSESKKSENIENETNKIKEKAKKEELSIFDFTNNLRTITDEEINKAPSIIIEVI